MVLRRRNDYIFTFFTSFKAFIYLIFTSFPQNISITFRDLHTIITKVKQKLIYYLKWKLHKVFYYYALLNFKGAI